MTSQSYPAKFIRSYHYDETQDGGVVIPVTIDRTIDMGVNSIEKADGLKGWRKIIEQGGNATTALSGTQYLLEDVGTTMHTGIQLNGHGPEFGYRDLKWKGQLMSPAWYDMPVMAFSDPGYTKADNQALARFYKKLASVESRFKGMVFTGELRETLHAIRHPALSLRKGLDYYLTALKRGSRISLRHRPRFVRDTWLEYSFGWRPLISDIDDAIKTFYASKLVRPIFEMVHAGGSHTVPDVAIRSNSLNCGYGFWVRWKDVIGYSYNVKYYGVYRSTGNGVESNHSYGFSPWEFAPTLWELIPYSFLVDYFSNIGDIVSSWSYRFLRADWASRGNQLEAHALTGDTDFVWEPDYFNPADYNHWIEGHPGVSVARKRIIRRDPSAPLNIPSLELQVPGMTSVKWINILALSKNAASVSKLLRGP